MDLIPPAIACDMGLIRRIIFASVYLPKDTPDYWSKVTEFVTNNKESKDILPSTVKTMVENLQLLNEKAFSTDVELSLEIHAFLPRGSSIPLGIILVSGRTECQMCGGKLLLRGDRPSHLAVYTDTFGTVVGTHYHKYCKHLTCKYRQYYGYHKVGDQSVAYYDSDWAQLEYFVSTSETAFDMHTMRKFDAELLLGHISYKQKADIYNYYNNYGTDPKVCSALDSNDTSKEATRHTPVDLMSRMKLDRRRFEAVHLRYAMLTIMATYPHIETIPMHTNVYESLKLFTPIFYECFTTRFAGHHCQFPGCEYVIVIDGNMKNRRDVCLAKHAGTVQYTGLPGYVKTGCIQTPAFKSRYCKDHTERICVRGDGADSADSVEAESVAEMLLEKKTTRKETYYKVLWLGRPEVEVSWEPASSLSARVIKEFEDGIACEAVETSDNSYGKQTSTLEVKTQLPTCPPTKKPKHNRPILESNTGAFANDSDSGSLTCRTEKDKHGRLNFRTAGIMAGMRPCGVIVLLTELFISESLPQVYGSLHEFYACNPIAASKTRFVCYDDACHLTKFAKNTSRANLTPQAQQLASVQMVVDKMHMKGHVDKWCKQNCDAKSFHDLDKVDTEVCEQVFSWLSRYKRITQKMNQHTFFFFLLYLSQLHNTHEEKKLQTGGFMS